MFIQFFGDKMNNLCFQQFKLTLLQENILLLLDKNSTTDLICKNLNIKLVTFFKITQTLTDKKLINDNKLTVLGKKMVHYINFRNDTILAFLKTHKIKETNDIKNQMRTLDYKVIIALRNTI